ncbi:hypothetical protein [Rhodococcus sp. 077-4]|uniref:hypothetical protein n=1 Tax=Rhodococcus sp. 077-4 TaxID=2789271 RepID=UPI0039F64121
MGLRITYPDGTTEVHPRVHSFNTHSGHLVARNEDGHVLFELDNVASAVEVTHSPDNEPEGWRQPGH